MVHKRSETNYTIDTARQDCMSGFNTTAVQLCMALPGFEIESYTENCIADALVSTVHVSRGERLTTSYELGNTIELNSCRR